MADRNAGVSRVALAAGFAIVALAMVVVIVAITAPANWLARWVADRTSGSVLLADARGTVWSGSAVVALGTPRVGATSAGFGGVPGDRLALPGRVIWTLDFARWLAPVLHLTHDGVLQERVDVRYAAGGLAIDAGAAVLPASMLRLAGAPLNTLSPDGRCELRWNALTVDEQGTTTGDGTLAIGELSLAISPVRPLGSYRVSWRSGDGRLTWQLATEQGPLEVEGGGVLPTGGKAGGPRPQVRLTVRPARDAPTATVAQLNTLLDMLGRRGAGEAVIESGGRT